ncbi:MAG: SEC-C metal-binding domain-containing protein, partial [Gammaproteobacteria bacterium]
SRVQVRAEEDVEAVERQRRRAAPVEYSHAEAGSSLEDRDQSADPPGPAVKSPVTRQHPKIGRNSLCPCGSGRKYKQCHGKLV